MRPEVGLVGETFSAFWAIEWFFARMCSDMTLKYNKKITIGCFFQIHVHNNVSLHMI